MVRKIHDGPEFHEAVFDWGSAHGDFHRGAHAAEQFTLFAIGVFDVLCFVDDNRLPFNFVKFGEVLAERGVSREQHVGVEFLQIAAAAVVREEREIRRELLDFDLPVAKEAGGHHDDGFFLREFALLFHLEEERNDLQRLAKAHVIGENATESDFQILVHPGVAAHLVGAECISRFLYIQE